MTLYLFSKKLFVIGKRNRLIRSLYKLGRKKFNFELSKTIKQNLTNNAQTL